MTFYEFMPQLINMSLTASVAIALVMLLRLLLRNAPKIVSYALWAVVLFRLLCPVSIESDFSLYSIFDAPAEESGAVTSVIEYVPANIVHMENPSVSLPLPGVSDAVNEVLPQGREQQVADPLEGPAYIATCVWIAGVLAMAAYGAFSYIRLRRKLVTAVPLKDNIFAAEGIGSPFVMGLLFPKIYLPYGLEERERNYVILHEQHHIRRFDHVTRALAFAALCIHWFNPLVWAAFVLSGKDMEMSCDEAVMRKMGPEVRADYSASLLSFTTGRRIIAATPLAFGEGDTRGRIENLARWKKPAVWIVAAAALVCVVAALALVTNPAGNTAKSLFPGYYQVEEIVYKNAKYAELDFLSEEDLPWVNLSSAGLLLLSDGGEWSNVGMMEETSLRKETFDDYFYGVTYESTPGEMRRSAKEAHLVITVPTAGNGIATLSQVEGLGEHGQLIFYAFSTRDGSAYLACGSWDVEALSDPMSDDSEFLWVARIAKKERVVEWFDHYRDDSAAQKTVDRVITLDEFPDVEFTCEPGSIRAGNDSDALFTGAPIWNAFFTDLTGDGLPEICATVGFAFGGEDDFIVIYDYANSVSYSLTDRGNYSYSLSLQADKLVVEKRSIASGETLEEGYLAYVDGTLTIVSSESSEASSSSPTKVDHSEAEGLVISTPFYTVTIPNKFSEGIEWVYRADESSMGRDDQWNDESTVWFGHQLSVSLEGDAPYTTFYIVASRLNSEGKYVAVQGGVAAAKAGEVTVNGQTWAVSVCKGLSADDPGDSTGEIKALVDEYATWVEVGFDPNRVTDDTVMAEFLESYVGQEWAAQQ